MSEKYTNVKFPKTGGKSFQINLNRGIKVTDLVNTDGFSDCENISHKKMPVICSSDIRISTHTQIDYYNLTSPSVVFENDGGSRMFSFDDYILLIRWGMCGEDIRDGYQVIKNGKPFNRDYKKGYHYVICDCLKPFRNSLVLMSSGVIYDEYAENLYNSDYDMYADPRLYVETSTHPDDMSDADTGVVYLFEGAYYYYDETWIQMKLNRDYLFDKKIFYYDTYLESWLIKKCYTDKMRDVTVFSKWDSDTPSLMYGKYKKYIVVMPDAVMIELDDSGFPLSDTYYDGDWIGVYTQRSPKIDVSGMKIHRLEACMTDSDGVKHYFPYPDLTAVLTSATRFFAVGDGRIYATKPNTVNDFSYDSVYSYSSSNAWAVSVSNEGTASSALCALCNFKDETIAFSSDSAYKIYGNTNPFRVGKLFEYGTFDQKSYTECRGKFYFANKKGIYCYNGISVTHLSEQLNLGVVKKAILTSLNGILYIYISSANQIAIYTYDTRTECFFKMSLPYDSYIESDDRQVKDVIDMVTASDNVYILTYASYDMRPGGQDTVNYDTSKVQIYSITGGSSAYDDYKEKWFFETNYFNVYIPDMQRIDGVEMVVKGDNGGFLRGFLITEDNTITDDNNKIFEHNCNNKLNVIRYKVRKSEGICHKLRIEGEGNVEIHSIIINTRSGGDKFESD